MYYKKVYSKKLISNKEVGKQKKWRSVDEQRNNADYTLDSVGIELVHKVNPGNYIYESKPDSNFGWYTRTGIPYKKDLPELTKKKLQGRRWFNVQSKRHVR